MKMREQCDVFLDRSTGRRRRPIGSGSTSAYGSYLQKWIIPSLGDLDLSDVKNSTVRALVSKMVNEGRKPATVNAVIGLVKLIVKSAVNEEGEPLYPRVWDNDLMDVPVVVKADQDAPVLAVSELQEALGRTQGQDKALYTILAASGLRIGELQALRARGENDTDSFWSPEKATIFVRSTFTQGRFQPWTKTDAGIREIDLHPAVNTYLMQAGLPKTGWLFRGTENPESHLSKATADRRLLKAGILKGFHAFRRFRLTHLASQNVPTQLIKFWSGHASPDITDRYIKIGQNIETRKKWAEQAGIGFQLWTE